MFLFGPPNTSVCLAGRAPFSRWGHWGSEMPPRLRPRTSETKMSYRFFSLWPGCFSPSGHTYDCISFAYFHRVNPWRKLNFLFLPAVEVISSRQQCFGWKRAQGALWWTFRGKKKSQRDTSCLLVRNPLFLFFIKSLFKESIYVWIYWDNNAGEFPLRKPISNNLNLQNGFVYSFHKYLHVVCDNLNSS